MRQRWRWFSELRVEDLVCQLTSVTPMADEIMKVDQDIGMESHGMWDP